MRDAEDPMRLAGLIPLLLIQVAEAYAYLPCIRFFTPYTWCIGSFVFDLLNISYTYFDYLAKTGFVTLTDLSAFLVSFDNLEIFEDRCICK